MEIGSLRYLLTAILLVVGGAKVALAEPEYRFDEGEFLAALNRGADRAILKSFYRRPAAVPTRPQPFPVTAAMRELGEKLFFDTRLGAGGQMGCVTCHQPARSFSDTKPRSVETSGRRSMTLFDLAWNTRFGWTGRINSLMSQAILAIEAPGGMATPRTVLMDKLTNDSGYRALFVGAYKGRVPAGLELHFDVVAHALEVYVGSLVSPRSSFDRWVEGDEAAVSEEAKRGFDLFNGRARCAHCHMSWRFTDGKTHDIGLSEDLGLAEFVPNDPAVRHHFKTPGLREVGKRAPYMHDGSLPSLEASVEFYNRGGNFLRPSRSKDVRPLGLITAESAALVEFLRTLTDDSP